MKLSLPLFLLIGVLLGAIISVICRILDISHLTQLIVCAICGVILGLFVDVK
jgi:hypothetical protein